jgi:hypothetical protein
MKRPEIYDFRPYEPRRVERVWRRLPNSAPRSGAG